MAKPKTDTELVRMINAYWGAPVARIGRRTDSFLDPRTGRPITVTYEAIVSDLGPHGYPQESAEPPLREAA